MNNKKRPDEMNDDPMDEQDMQEVQDAEQQQRGIASSSVSPRTTHATTDPVIVNK